MRRNVLSERIRRRPSVVGSLGDGEQRIDMPLEGWREIRHLAHIGFQHQIPNYEQMLKFPFRTAEEAQRAEAAIEKLEFAIGYSKIDPEYSDSLARNMLIWNQWPSDAQAGASGREG